MQIIEYDESAIPEESRMRLNDDLERARETAMRILASTGRSKKDLIERLVGKGHEREICEELVERLDSVGLINEYETAAMIARTRLAEKGRSRAVIGQELKTKGYPEDAIAAALEQIQDVDERLIVLELARKRLAKDLNLDRNVRIRRTLGHLARKGYSQGLAMSCIREVLAQEIEQD